MSPELPKNHQTTAARPRPRTPSAATPPAKAAAETAEFFGRLAARSPRWRLTAHQRRRLTPAVAAALAAGWTAGALAEVAGANTAGIRNPAAVLTARLSPTDLPPPPGSPRRPPWCGDCDQRTRMLDYDGDTPRPCPRCKPLRPRATARLDGQQLHRAQAIRERPDPDIPGPSRESTLSGHCPVQQDATRIGQITSGRDHKH